jgi:hypothetical protein
MERFEPDSLVTTLESLRPAPSPAFVAELDERAAAGFPRRAGAHQASPLRRFLTRLGEIQARQVLIPAGATALAAIVVATVVIAAQEPGTDSSNLARLNPTDRPAAEPAAKGFTGAGGTASPPAAEPGQDRGASGVQYEPAVPTVEGSASGVGASAAGSAPSSANPTGPYAARARHREVERSAQMVLGADPADVGNDAAKVFDAVHAVDGIVLSSSVRGGEAGDAGARFELLIPSAKLGDALASFSAIDTVVSRHEATDDITAPTVRAGEQLRDSRAKIDGLLAQLASAGTEAERASAEAELRAERRHNAYLRSQLSTLERRANLSRVSLRIETGAASPFSSSDDGWGIGDALGDAGHILGIAAGVAIVGLAILAPIALIALLVWLANRARLRRARERTLA